MLVQLSYAVEESIGEVPRFVGYHGAARAPVTTSSLGYLGHCPGVVVFELAVILGRQVGLVAHREGYDYGPHDVVDELRPLIVQIGSPHTDVMGRELVFYWPNVLIGRSS